MDITIQQLPYNITIIIKSHNKKIMIALSDDTRTNFIGEIDFVLYAIWWTHCLKSTGRSYTFLVMHFWRYAMIMIPFKPALEVTPGRLIIYLYYVPL